MEILIEKDGCSVWAESQSYASRSHGLIDEGQEDDEEEDEFPFMLPHDMSPSRDSTFVEFHHLEITSAMCSTGEFARSGRVPSLEQRYNSTTKDLWSLDEDPCGCTIDRE